MKAKNELEQMLISCTEKGDLLGTLFGSASRIPRWNVLIAAKFAGDPEGQEIIDFLVRILRSRELLGDMMRDNDASMDELQKFISDRAAEWRTPF